MLRPDGFLASALSGAVVQCVGPVQVQAGALRAGDYEVGVFYLPGNEGYRRAEDSLQPPPERAP